ncbi:exopolysaccharide biosynthesis polyprenyl glycosylphosphotransferase [Chromohalobacter canadensis]|uniref:Exopolysaccharide biosynthesis polyprenyl glycosylphosphotransferase n=1 Tax=Chromohalobacter canadensis TaxID=141389 RepID=A0ABZ0YA60_9GAMM|nr:exopolysaccharide biosynthesis polyprenyl glycosylphosphotransferase [Chromohalobacter canadensis]MCK0769383.1 exopolysaccharide biosynthesis polyprenyl glycosylphosphotransferase [Chromohalobacter canadensis]WQH08956.1 exopolysaccharide biosynthesis polyprenyl glycosylphosphotransferase [Chromohalobacter canadensis]
MFNKHKVLDKLDRSAWGGSESLVSSVKAFDTRYERRHSRWYEQCLMGMPFHFIVGLPAVVMVPPLMVHGEGFWRDLAPGLTTTLWAVGAAFLITLFVLHRMARFPGTQASVYVVPLVSAVFVAVWAFLLGAERFDESVLLGGYVASLLWFFIGYAAVQRFRRPRFAVVPLGEARHLGQADGGDMHRLEVPRLGSQRIDGIVADLHSDALNSEWMRFLTQCMLHGIPVYQLKQLDESRTGRVKLEHLADTELTSLLPSPLYSICKRGLDICGALLLLPLLAPIMLATAWAVRRDSPGPVLFVQWRLGHRDVPFRIYKFRSMYCDREGEGVSSKGDPRITPVGKVIRKYRLDELPQLFNVLKGDMSFIGPRPELVDLSQGYEKDVPFFSYRRAVKPGISGWAQVEQGYAAEIDEMVVKLQYDLYYIKHFSLWLDLLILFRTLRTVSTGVGSR